MSHIERQEVKRGLLLAGWEQVGGSWKHASVGGLHNFKSAATLTEKWVADWIAEPSFAQRRKSSRRRNAGYSVGGIK